MFRKPRVYETTVKSIETDKNGKLKAVNTVKLEFVTDEKSGRRVPKEIPGTEKKLAADLLIIAAGFLGAEEYTAEAFGVELTPRTVVKTEAGSYKTNVENVFTAGDMHRGQSLVVWAIAEGRACAKQVDEYLMDYSFMTE